MGIRQRFTTAVIAVGDENRQDDDVQFAVMTRLAQRDGRGPLPPRTTLAATLPDARRLIRLWDGLDLVVVVTTVPARPGQPARVHRLEVGDVPPHPAATAEAGGSRRPEICEAVALARALDRLPVRMVVYAVECAGATAGAAGGAGARDGAGNAETVAEHIARRIEEEILSDQEVRSDLVEENSPLLAYHAPDQAVFPPMQPGPAAPAE